MMYEYVTWNLLTQEFENEFGTFKFNWKKKRVFYERGTSHYTQQPTRPSPQQTICLLIAYFPSLYPVGLPHSDQLLKSYHLIVSI